MVLWSILLSYRMGQLLCTQCWITIIALLKISVNWSYVLSNPSKAHPSTPNQALLCTLCRQISAENYEIATENDQNNITQVTLKYSTWSYTILKSNMVKSMKKLPEFLQKKKLPGYFLMYLIPTHFKLLSGPHIKEVYSNGHCIVRINPQMAFGNCPSSTMFIKYLAY